MDFSKIALFSMMKTKMGYLSERQEVLSQNIANVDTPGYKAKDVVKPDFDRMVMHESSRLEMRAASSGESLQPTQQGRDFDVKKNRKAYEVTPTKNNVVIEEQMMKVAQTSMEYEKTTNMYKKMADMFKTAIGNR